jgi:hypothetical protein
MPTKLGEVTLSRKELEEALKILNEGCTEQVTVVFGEARLIGAQVSDGFAIEPKAIHCLYGCKDEKAILAALDSRKGIASDPC